MVIFIRLFNYIFYVILTSTTVYQKKIIISNMNTSSINIRFLLVGKVTCPTLTEPVEAPSIESDDNLDSSSDIAFLLLRYLIKIFHLCIHIGYFRYMLTFPSRCIMYLDDYSLELCDLLSTADVSVSTFRR